MPPGSSCGEAFSPEDKFPAHPADPGSSSWISHHLFSYWLIEMKRLFVCVVSSHLRVPVLRGATTEVNTK